MNSPFIYKYQPIKLKDFEMEHELMDLLNTFMEMNSLNILLVGRFWFGENIFDIGNYS